MGIFCRHKWHIKTKNSFITNNSESSYHSIQFRMQFMCEKCYNFKDKIYYICYIDAGIFSRPVVSENRDYIKRITNQNLIRTFDDRQTMVDTIEDDLEYQSFIKKLEKKYGITID